MLLGVVCASLLVTTKQAKSDEVPTVIVEQHVLQHKKILQEKEEQRLAEEKAKQEALYNKAVSLVGKKIGPCVIGARYFAGVGRDKVQGWAKNNKTNSSTPVLGAILITSESIYGHAAVVIQITETTITVFETNYHWNGRGGIRTINKDYKRIKGYII